MYLVPLSLVQMIEITSRILSGGGGGIPLHIVCMCTTGICNYYFLYYRPPRFFLSNSELNKFPLPFKIIVRLFGKATGNINTFTGTVAT